MGERQAMTSSEWLKEFHAMRADFDSSRRCLSAVVRITFADRSHVFAAAMRAGPGAGFLTIDVYPPAPPEGMVENADGLPLTPTAIMVPLGTISRVELMTEAPDARAVGFGAPRDPEPAG
jgi:hypothetical protein